MNRPIWNFVTSLRLTVVCLSFGILLVFIGTLAQADEGLYQAQARYFKQWYIYGPILFGHRLPLLLPGGYLIGTVLLLNLAAAHVKRFVWSSKKLGIHLTHLGIVVLLVGQLATDMLARESMLRLREGETKNYTESHREHELVFASDAAAAGAEEVVSIPEPLVAKRADITHEKLPFTVRITDYHVNGEVYGRAGLFDANSKLTTALATVEGQYANPDGLIPLAETASQSEGRVAVWREALAAVGEKETADIVAAAKRVPADRQAKLREELKTRFQQTMIERFQFQRESAEMRFAAEKVLKKEPVTEEAFPVPARNGGGRGAVVVARPESKEMDQNNLPYAVIEVIQGKESLGSWLVSPMINPQDIVVGGKTWRVAFRPERVYQPFSVKLLDTTHEVYRGTEIPKNFQSRVHIENVAKGETRDVDIYMNSPLRYEGRTFFQYQMAQDEHEASIGISTLQVVRNPSWLTPYLGCILVALGMIYQFLFHLTGFITKRKAA
ncbi:MAG: hypothetical protein JWL90_4519 [Chthoniobacteraceae bacterium]|nr:hypothetical protein [Chthoniobacteraceae bacterium]